MGDRHLVAPAALIIAIFLTVVLFFVEAASQHWAVAIALLIVMCLIQTGLLCFGHLLDRAEAEADKNEVSEVSE